VRSCAVLEKSAGKIDARTLMALLSDSHERSYAEIARVLDLPVGSIGPTRARCLAKLRPLLAG